MCSRPVPPPRRTRTCQRGDRQPRQPACRRTDGLPAAGASQRRRESRTVVQRCHSDRAACQRGRSRCGSGWPRRCGISRRELAGQGEAFCRHREGRSHAPDGRDSAHARPGVFRLRRPGGQGVDRTDRAVARAAGARDRRHRGRHRAQRSSGVRRQGLPYPGGRDRTGVLEAAEPFRGAGGARRRGRGGRRIWPAVAAALTKIANDLRLLGSGPRCRTGRTASARDPARHPRSCRAR
jgi:hypothetical protein